MSSSFSKASLRGLSSQNQIFNDANCLTMKDYVGVEQDSYYSNSFFHQRSKLFLSQPDGNFWCFPSWTGDLLTNNCYSQTLYKVTKSLKSLAL